MSEQECMNKYEYGAFELNDKGEIICNLHDQWDFPPIHVKGYYGNEDEGRCADKRGVLHLLNELADENKSIHKIEYLHSLLIKSYAKRDELTEKNKQLKTECEIYKTENLKLFNALKAMCDVEICQVCKHNESLVYESMMYPTEYDSRCKKGFKDPGERYDGVEVQECDDFEVFEDW